jgi:predicted nucleic acid-binding protein
LANYFFDTSAFVKRYHPELGSDRVLALFDQPQNRIQISRLTLAEARSAFAVKVRTGSISAATGSALWVQLLSDLATGVFEVLPITDSHYKMAEHLLGQYAFQFRLRTLDALPLAVALEQNEYFALDGFVPANGHRPMWLPLRGYPTFCWFEAPRFL